MTEKKYSNIVISSDPMRHDHIVSAIKEFAQGENLVEIVEKCKEFDDAWESDNYEIQDWILYEEIFPLIDAITEDGFYFGTEEGDGACLGFFQCDDVDFDSIDIPEFEM